MYLYTYLLLLMFVFFVNAKKTASDVVENVKNDDFITVCGINATYIDCICAKNNHLLCDVSFPVIPTNIIYTNVKVLNETFIIRSAQFFACPITILKKNKILPGNEHLIENIAFNVNHMKTIENGSFGKFTSLKTLEITTNDITNFPEEIWGSIKVSNLEVLRLCGNKFTNLSSISFARLTNLIHLNLYDSRYIDFTHAIFPIELSKLKILDLGSSQIKILKENAFHHLE